MSDGHPKSPTNSAAAAKEVDWVVVPAETAQAHPLYGTGGWLAVLIIAHFCYALLLLVSLYTGLQMDIASFAPVFRTLITISLVLEVALLIWLFINVWLLLNKSAVAVRSVFAYLAVALALVFADALATKFAPAQYGFDIGWDRIFATGFLFRFGWAAGTAALVIPYLLRSRRVNVTLLSRMRSDELKALTRTSRRKRSNP